MQNGNGREVVIVEAVRTPIGRGHPEKGYYKDTHPNELLGKTYTEVIERAGIDASEVRPRRSTASVARPSRPSTSPPP
jgi:acetyl-CoA acetyltransferase